MTKKIKQILKPIYHAYLSMNCVLRRTIFSPLHGLKIPFNRNIQIGSRVKFFDGTRVYFYKGELTIKDSTEICSFSKFIIGGGNLTVGEECLLGEYGIYNVFANLTIGNNVLTADRVSFVTNIHEYEDVALPIRKQPCVSDEIVIGDGTWIGMNATILAGSHVGKNCVIAANCVVKGNYPDYCVIGGVPSKIIKKYNIGTKKWEKNT